MSASNNTDSTATTSTSGAYPVVTPGASSPSAPSSDGYSVVFTCPSGHKMRNSPDQGPGTAVACPVCHQVAFVPLPPSLSSPQEDAAPTEGQAPARTTVGEGTVRYIYVSAGQHCSYFVRSDGKVDRSSGSGKIDYQMVPPQGVMYTSASSGPQASYLLRSDGKVDRVADGKVSATMENKDGLRYVNVSAGSHASYLLKSDGSVERTTGGGKVEETVMRPADGQMYVCPSAGTEATYLLKNNGSIDRITWGGGKINQTITCNVEGVDYRSISTQCATISKNNESTNPCNYFVRSDGKVDRTFGSGKISHTINPPQGLSYISASTAVHASYLVRSDGAVDRTTGGGKIQRTINPPPGTRYTVASAGEYASYFVRDDGLVDRTTGSGTISLSMSPPMNFQPNENCVIL